MKAAVIGASGLIGGHIVNILAKQDHFQEVVILVRKNIQASSPKIRQVIVDFEDHTQFQQAVEGCEIVFCSVGTTQAKVKGDMQAYRKVDYDIPVNAARLAAKQGCKHFLLVSSVGADANASNFYLKMKGSVENEIARLHLPRFSVFRPSMLLGQRSEFRLGERIGQILMVAFSFLIPSKYKPIDAREVAMAMVNSCLTPAFGSQEILEYKGIKSILNS